MLSGYFNVFKLDKAKLLEGSFFLDGVNLNPPSYFKKIKKN